MHSWLCFCSLQVCSRRLGPLRDMLSTCSSAQAAQLGCGVKMANAFMLVNPEHCQSSQKGFLDIVTKYSRGAFTAAITCTVDGGFRVGARCAETVALLNRATSSHLDGSFGQCHLSTLTTTGTTTKTTSLSSTRTTSATTSGTTTATTTVTSSQTSTPVHGQIQCHVYRKEGFLATAARTSCDVQAHSLNRVLKACTGKTGSIGCYEFDGAQLLVDTQQCDADLTESALGKLVSAYTRGTIETRLQCQLGGFLSVKTGQHSCSFMASILNGAIDSHTDGSFGSCHMSTPTTSATTTATTSLTSTPTTTTTPTSSRTTTPTTSLTTSTSPTTTQTTTQTTTPTSSDTTTATTTAMHGKFACGKHKTVSYFGVHESNVSAFLQAKCGAASAFAVSLFFSPLVSS